MSAFLNTVTAFLVLCLFAHPVSAFSGNGTRLFRLGKAFANPDGKDGLYLRGRDAVRAGSMTRQERLLKSIEYFEDALRCSPSSAQRTDLEQALGTVHNRLALCFSSSGDYEEAVEHAQNAIRLIPGNAVLYFNLASFQSQAGDTYESALNFEKALENAQGPFRRRVTSAFADLLINRGINEDKSELNRALRLINDSLCDDENNSEMLQKKALVCFTLSDWKGSIEAYDKLRELGVTSFSRGDMQRYTEATGRLRAIEQRGEAVEERSGYILNFDPDFDEELTDTVIGFINDARDSLTGKFGLVHRSSITVYLHRTREYNMIHQTNYAAGTQMLNRIDISVVSESSPEKLKDVIFHEFAHYLTRKRTNSHVIPVWFNEGIAQFCEPNLARDPEEKLKVYRVARSLYRQKLVIPVDALENSGALDNDTRIAAYVQSYFMLLHLSDEYGFRNVLTLLDDVAKGIPFDSAFESCFGENQETFFDNWRPRLKSCLLSMRDELRKHYRKD